MTDNIEIVINRLTEHWKFNKTFDKIASFSKNSTLYYSKIKNNEYIVFNHFCTDKTKEFQGFDCWLCEFKTQKDIGQKEPLKCEQVKLAVKFPEDIDLITKAIMDENKFPEAEVILRYLNAKINEGKVDANKTIYVNLDGQHIGSKSGIVFCDVIRFMEKQGWKKQGNISTWKGLYIKNYNEDEYTAELSAQVKHGDLKFEMKNGKTLIVECKKGTLTKSKSSQENSLLKGVIGQLVISENFNNDNFIYSACIPETEKYRELIEKYGTSSGLIKLNINLETINRDNIIKDRSSIIYEKK